MSNQETLELLPPLFSEIARAFADHPDGWLVLMGVSGCGKTHLLRGFRRHVQEYGRGFIVYAIRTASNVAGKYHLRTGWKR